MQTFVFGAIIPKNKRHLYWRHCSLFCTYKDIKLDPYIIIYLDVSQKLRSPFRVMVVRPVLST